MKRKTCFVNYITQRIPSVTGVVLELISYTLFLRTHSQLTVWLSTDVKIWWNKCRNLNIYYCAKSLEPILISWCFVMLSGCISEVFFRHRLHLSYLDLVRCNNMWQVDKHTAKVKVWGLKNKNCSRWTVSETRVLFTEVSEKWSG